MCRQKLKAGLAIAIVGLSGNALAFTTDGDLNDWLQGNSWVVKSGIGVNQNSNGTSAGYGGQAYDAELMVATVDWNTNTLHAAIITGLAPESGVNDLVDTGTNGWRPGDLAIYTGTHYTSDQLWNVNNGPIVWTNDWAPSGDLDTASTSDSNVYGLYLPDERDSAGTLDTDGDSGRDGNTGTNPVQRAVVQGARWYTNERSSSSPEFVTSMYENEGVQQGPLADVVYTEATFNGADFRPDGLGNTDEHYLIEMAISLTSLGWTSSGTGTDTFNVALQWGMNCANDWINGSGSFSFTRPGDPEPSNQVPEPGAFALLALGLVGVGYGKRRSLVKR